MDGAGAGTGASTDWTTGWTWNPTTTCVSSGGPEDCGANGYWTFSPTFGDLSFGAGGGASGEGGGGGGGGGWGSPPQQKPESKDPKSSTCTSAFAGPAYKAGGILTEAGTGAIAVGAGVALIGGGNPVTNAIGGAFAFYGSGAVAVGTFAQLNAGAYYLLHGNPQPLRNLAINRILGLVKTPKVANPSLDKIAEGAIGASSSPTPECAP